MDKLYICPKGQKGECDKHCSNKHYDPHKHAGPSCFSQIDSCPPCVEYNPSTVTVRKRKTIKLNYGG